MPRSKKPAVKYTFPPPIFILDIPRCLNCKIELYPTITTDSQTGESLNVLVCWKCGRFYEN